MSKPIILLLLLAGLFAGFAGPALAQTEVTQRIPVAVIVNGQQTQGVTVVLNGTVQTFSCANPQPYITTNQSSSGWACYDQNSGTWLLQALPPQSTAGYTPTDSYSYYGNPYPYSYYSYYPNSYYPYSYPYSYYPYFYGPAFAFGFGFGHGYYGYGRNFYGPYGNARVGSVHGTGGFVAHGGGFAHSGGGFAHGGGGFAHAGGFAHGGGGHMGGGHR